MKFFQITLVISKKIANETMKRFLLLFVLIIITFFVISFSTRQKSDFAIHKVVIDAGHGGEDPGCVGSQSKEKDVTLSIALKLGQYIERNFADVEVIFTRNTDEFIELYRRARIANENKADLFISIHCNANPSPKPYGVETFVMGLHKSQANLDVAKKENSSILLENNYSEKYEGYNPNSPEANIIFSLFQNAYLDQSLDFATRVQRNICGSLNMNDRKVKQAGFLVLFKTAMPSVLIETGFLSNAKEEEYLSSIKGQEEIAFSIYNAFKEYKLKKEGIETKKPANTKPQNIKPKPTKTIEDSVLVIKEKPKTTKTDKPKKDMVVKKDTLAKKVVKNNINKKDTTHKVVADKPINNKTESTKVDYGDIIFKVQFATTKTMKPLNAPEFKGIKNIDVYVQNGLYKYTVGNLKTLEDAVELQGEIIAKGFKGAFVVPFLNGVRITPEEVIAKIKKSDNKQ